MNIEYQRLLLSLTNHNFINILEQNENYCLAHFNGFIFKMSPFKRGKYSCIHILIRNTENNYSYELETSDYCYARNYLSEMFFHNEDI